MWPTVESHCTGDFEDNTFALMKTRNWIPWVTVKRFGAGVKSDWRGRIEESQLFSRKLMFAYFDDLSWGGLLTQIKCFAFSVQKIFTDKLSILCFWSPSPYVAMMHKTMLSITVHTVRFWNSGKSSHLHLYTAQWERKVLSFCWR